MMSFCFHEPGAELQLELNCLLLSRGCCGAYYGIGGQESKVAESWSSRARKSWAGIPSFPSYYLGVWGGCAS